MTRKLTWLLALIFLLSFPAAGCGTKGGTDDGGMTGDQPGGSNGGAGRNSSPSIEELTIILD